MFISPSALGILIIVATAIAAVVPIVLLVLWLKERSRGDLW